MLKRLFCFVRHIVITNSDNVMKLNTSPIIPQFMWKLIEPGCPECNQRPQIIVENRTRIEIIELISVAIFILVYSISYADEVVNQHIN